MVKKDSLLDRVNSFYAGQTIYFATKHGKEGIVAPLLSELGIGCCRIDVVQYAMFLVFGYLEASLAFRANGAANHHRHR
jgi:hypothetical protein